MRYKAIPLAARTPRSTPRARASSMPPSTVATWVATALMAILPLGVLMPLALANASTASLSVVPSSTMPGGSVTVMGVNFAEGERGSLVLDDGSVLARFKASRSGAFSIVTVIPSSVSTGSHTLHAIASRKGRPTAGGEPATVLASASLEVLEPSVATPSPTPIPTPTPTPPPPPTPPPTPTPPPSPTPTAAPSNLTFVESQAWWIQTPGKTGTDFGHLHVAAWIPTQEVVSGTLTLKLRFVLHDNPGTFAYFNPVLKTDSQEISLPHDESLTGWTCSGTCMRTVTTTIDTTLSDYDGIQEIRIRAYVDEPDGNRMHASVNALVDIQNGAPENPIDRRAYQRFKGWYTGSGYCEADILSDLPVGSSVKVQAVHHGSAEDLPVSRYIVTVDADVHAGIPGTVIAQGTGELPPTVLDLSRFPAGEHRLAIRAECDDPRGSTNAGVGVTTFTVP